MKSEMLFSAKVFARERSENLRVMLSVLTTGGGVNQGVRIHMVYLSQRIVKNLHINLMCYVGTVERGDILGQIVRNPKRNRITDLEMIMTP